MMRHSDNVIDRVSVVRKLKTAPSTDRTVINIPFSLTGIAAVLACPLLLGVELISPTPVMIGIVYIILLTMLGNERRTLIALYTAMAMIMLSIDLRMIYAQPEAQMAIADKFLTMILLPVLALVLMRKRNIESTIPARKPVCTVSFKPVVNDRRAFTGETKTVFRHMRESKEVMDDFSRELIWFVYSKSPKN